MTGHLIHAGYPKTGSNFLRRWFKAHPQLAYQEGGIAGWRMVYDISRQSAQPAQGALYRVTSSESLLSPHRSVGDSYVDYSNIRQMADAQREACELMAAIFPNAHVLMVTRGFRSMLFSSYSQFVRTGGDFSIQEMLALSNRAEMPWNYDAVIAMYARAFGDEKVIVMPYELLRDDPSAFTRAIEDRLGLAHFEGPRDRVNTALSPVELLWYPRLTRFVRRLPIGFRLKRMYVRGVFGNRFRLPIAMLQRLRPGTPVTADAVPDDVLRSFRGMAESLRGNPLYAPYARDYFDFVG